MNQTNPQNAILDGFDDNTLGGSRIPFLKRGSYDEVAIVKFETGKTFKKQKSYFDAIVRILKSSGEGATPAGETATVRISERPYGYHVPVIKDLVGAVLNENPKTVTSADVTGMLSPTPEVAKLIEGVRLRIDVVPQKDNPKFDEYQFFAIASSHPAANDAPTTTAPETAESKGKNKQKGGASAAA